MGADHGPGSREPGPCRWATPLSQRRVIIAAVPEFTCQSCGDEFALPQHVLDRYPGWTPRQCRSCRDGGGASAPARSSTGSGSRSKTKTRTSSQVLTTEQVLVEFTAGPQDGVFTDGGSVPNPGPGGWGAVYVVGGEIVDEAFGHDPDTTNNRMELTALLGGMRLVPGGVPATIYTDSRLVVDTITKWAAGWKQRGWKRKTGPVENLDLVEPAFELYASRPELRLEWIAAHSGDRWNEYADALAGRWRL